MKTTKGYIELVRKFPLVPIKNDVEHKAAIQLSLELGKRDAKMTASERDYYRVLALLIHDYESRRVKNIGSASPRELLKFLAKEHNLKQVDIARIIGHESHVSTFLAGKRSLSKTEAVKLGNYFSVDPMALLPVVWKKAS